MKTIGIIAEFNPFHNGHAHLIREAKKLTGADRCVVVMSGAFTQRGIPACVYKYDRVKHALMSGIDVVLELPVSFSTATAETFAFGGVTLLNSLGCIDILAFGSECGDISLLSHIAEELSKPSPIKEKVIKESLNQGLTYPAARAKAYPEYSDILNNPNNILGIEYIKSLKRIDSTIQPFTITRKGSGFHDTEINHFPSALGLREAMKEIHNTQKSNLNPQVLDTLSDSFPEPVYNHLCSQINTTWPIFLDDMTELAKFALLRETPESICDYQDMNIDIARRFIKSSMEYNNLSSILNGLKTKELTYTRLSRCMLHTILKLKDLTRDDKGNLIPCPYTRILGFRKDASDIMHEISRVSAIPIITKAADAKTRISPEYISFFDTTIQADRIYGLILNSKFHTKTENDIIIGPLIM